MKKANSTIRQCLAAIAMLFIAGSAVAQINIDRTFTAGGFLNETGWEIYNVNTGVVYDCEEAGTLPNAVGGTVTLNVPAGDYQLTGFDSFGDGWNGGSMEITVTATGANLCGPVTHTGGGINTCNGAVSPGGAVLCSFAVSPPCDITCPGNIAVDNTPGICGAIVTFDVPSSGCVDPVVIDPPSGSIFPVGTTTVTATSGSNGCSFDVTVTDVELPVITCPSDITINLGDGECSAFYSYTVSATDNCTGLGNSGAVSAPPSASNGQDGIQFDIRNDGGLLMTINSWDIRLSGSGPVEVYYTTTANTAIGNSTNAGAWTLLGSANVAGSGFTAGSATVNVPVGGLQLAPGESKGIYITGVGPTIVGYSNGNITSTDGTLSIISNGHAGGTYAFGSQFSPRSFHGAVNYSAFAGEPAITQTMGLPSGDEFFIGETTNCFTAADPINPALTASCCFKVTVNENPNTTQNLTCNDNVQISLDENCSATIGADMILEGGPYGCFDTRYTVMVLSPVGQNLGNTVNDNFIGGNWTVKVVDNQTGQSCWGTIKVEDKIAPVVDCESYNLPCTFPYTTAIAESIDTFPTSATLPIAYNGFFEETLTIPVNGIPAGALVTDVDLYTQIDDTWGFIDMYLVSPDGTAVGIDEYVACFGQGFDVTWNDEAECTLLCVDIAGGGEHPNITADCGGFPENFFPPAADMVEFDGGPAVGDWTFVVADRQGENGSGLGTGSINEIFLILSWFDPNAPDYLPAVTENCGAYTLDVEDSFVNGACGGASQTVTRTWIATDEYGNASDPCVMTVTLDRPTLDDIVIPADIKWSCAQYDIFPNITDATALHRFITDCDDATSTIDADCYNASCDDLDFSFQDNPAVNSTVNGGGCPGFGLDDADVLSVTGSGYPSIFGRPLEGLCGIGVEHEDITVAICDGTWKVVRQWTMIDWCADPVDVRQINQVIKVVDDEAPIIALFGVNGETENNYGNPQIPALGNGGGCGSAPNNSGGTVFTAHVQLPGTGQQFNPDMFTNIELSSVYINLSHQHVEDLDIYLRGPSNKVIELTTDNGINGTGYINTKFVDGATPITQGASPFSGVWSPEGTDDISCGGFNGNVATLADMVVNWQADVLGTWELIVFDDNADNIGQMIDWSVNFDFGDVLVDVYSAAPTGNLNTVCAGSILVPPIQDCTDNCSGVAGYVTELWTRDATGAPAFQIGTIAGNGGYFDNVPMFENGLPARYIVRYYAVDACDNQAFVDMNIRLRDKVPPVAVCDEITEVSITNNGQGTGSSCSTLYAQDLDDGSHDNCTPVYYLMAKMGDSFSQDIYNRCYYPSRDFCCEDVGDNTVIMLVLDQDPSIYFTTLNSATLGCDGTPGLFLSTGFNAINFNTCMVTVQVTDKLPPVLISCPANERISCDQYASEYETQLANAADDEEQCAILGADFGNAYYFDNCVANVTCNVNINVDQCLEGTIRRTWSASDDAGNTNSSQNCNQTIFVDHVSDFVVEFPADLNAECGNTPPDFGEPSIFYETCELVAVSYTDQIFTDEPGACYKIKRQWTVINWCVVGDDIDQEVEENSELDLRLAGCLSIVNLECDLDGDGDCDDRTFRDSWAVCTLPNANDATDATGPDTDTDSDPWDGYITYEQVIKVSDTVDPVFTNGCDIPEVCIGDNTCAASVLLPTPDIDECSPNYVLDYSIYIGGQWLHGAGPYLNIAPGTYDVRYVANDNCNNQTACETTVTVRDCKKPTPYCKNGIVVELMVPVNAGDNAMVDVWASDLNDNSFDNCPGALKFSFSANTDDNGRTFTCADLGQNEVELWVTDAAGNQDFCVTSIIIQANMGQCDDDPIIAGVTATEIGEGVQDVNVNINSPAGFDVNVVTDNDGVFMNGVPAGGDYTVTPVLDENPLNGVTTYDLVVISKHILGVDLLDSPYQIIAADANKSNSVTTFDLVELRKLILFINTEFPNNTSWRFVDKDYAFANASNPFAAQFPEVINLNNLTSSELAADFVAIKVGDVNGSAAVNFASTEDRNMVGDLVLNTDDVILTEGETYTVEFKATDFAVSGYQFTLNFDRNALDFVEVLPGLATEANFGLTMVNEGVITTSWNSNSVKTLATGDVVYGLTFTAKQSGRLSNMLNINSRYTTAEAYTADAELLNVALSFNNTLVADGFELYQNTPNPFASNTTIGFYLPEATSATLTISDVQGKVVKVIEQDFVKGYNQVDLKRSDLGATGVLYYRLDTDSDSATRMMILVD